MKHFDREHTYPSPEQSLSHDEVNHEAEDAPGDTSQDKKIKSPKKSTKQKLGRALQIAGAVTGLAGGIHYAPKLHVAGAEAAASHQDSWEEASPLEKFALPAKNNLPDHASPADIDPRYAQKDILKYTIDTSTGAQKIMFQQELQNFDDQIKKGTGWADNKRQTMFNSLLKNPELRKQLQQEPGLTVADAFSLIKATVLDSSTDSYEHKLAHKLKERRQMLEKEFIGPHTDQVIIFNYASKDAGALFSGAELQKMAQTALGNKAAKHPEKYIQMISTEEVHDRTQATAGDALVKAIETSRGTTSLYLNTHASANELAIDLSDPHHQQTLKIDGFASALLNRMVSLAAEGHAKEAQDSLAHMNIIIDGCEGYDFSKKVVSAMKTMYEQSGFEKIIGADFEHISLPTIVTMAGEKSSVLAVDQLLEHSKPSGSRGLTSEPYMQLIKQNGGLTGNILFQLQSETYVSGGDMTFFIGKQGGLEEISSFQQPKKSPGTFDYGGTKLQYGSSEKNKNV